MEQGGRDQDLLRQARWPALNRAEESLRVVDLFSGAGGMSLGAFMAAVEMRRGFQVALAVEHDVGGKALYEHNFRRYGERADAVLATDVEQLFDADLDYRRLSRTEAELRSVVCADDEVDLLVGGPPCQGHSDLNNHTRRHDDRNGLYGRMARAAKTLEPTVIIIENVRQVIHDRSGIVSRTEEALAERYELEHRVLDFAGLGVPQIRRRHVLIGVHRSREASRRLSSLDRLLSQPEETRSVDWAIGDLASAYMGEGRGFDQSTVPSSDNRSRLDWFRTNPRSVNLPDSERPTCHRDKPHSYRAVYGRLSPDRPANTITTGFGSMGQGRYVHPHEPRTITPHEAARLQTFPDFFEFEIEGVTKSGWARAIGNAVPPLGMARVVRALFDLE